MVMSTTQNPSLSSSEGASSSPRHLVVFVHGMWGAPHDVRYMCTETQKWFGEDAVCMLSKVNAYLKTYHGIDVCGERLFEEVVERLSGGEFDRISFVGYSAGGLFSRYCMGLLYAKGYLERITLLNFVTCATPHLGIRRSKNRVYNAVAKWMVYRTGKQMVLEDNWHGKGPLIVFMSTPGSVFFKALEKCERLVTMANVVFDRTVPYHTASVQRRNPYKFGNSHATMLDGYPHIVANDDARTLLDLANIGQKKRAHFPKLTALSEAPASAFMVGRFAIVACLLPILLVGLPVSSVVMRAKAMKHPVQPKHTCDNVLGESGKETGVEVADPKEAMSVNMNTLPWFRVDAKLPGPHTHGRIVVRRELTDSCGRDVVAFMCQVAMLHTAKGMASMRAGLGVPEAFESIPVESTGDVLTV